MDQYWICKKKILLFVSYSIGTLKLISGNNSSHPDYRTSETLLSLFPYSCRLFVCSNSWTVESGGKLSALLSLRSCLCPAPAGLSSRGRSGTARGSATSQTVPYFRVCPVL